ncbi:MAG: sodium:solute symporter family protein [Gammaproteobacteria bacterium]
MSLFTWSWLFLAGYVAMMIAFGIIGKGRVQHADDFATARHGYGPLFLALAFSATTASGATFLGIPGLAYKAGLPSLWLLIGYPLGTYIGVLICLRIVTRGGDHFGSRSIPEYLGDRYQSEAIRLLAAVVSLLLLTYLAGQLLAGLVMFEQMLGLSAPWALLITSVVLLAYVEMGGAHADILTDGVQGALMLILAIGLAVLFITGWGFSGGFDELLSRLKTLDPHAVAAFNPGQMLFASPWAGIAIIIAHIPLGLMPHLGNKLWALRDPRDRNRFLIIAFVMALILPAMALGGIMARGVLGDDLMAGGANQALPLLFKEIFPTWLAAFLGVGILAAVMSTADGLVISTSQIFANDIYRRTIVPRMQAPLSGDLLDRRILSISRWTTLVVMVAAAGLAWIFMGMNVTLLIWLGIGGTMAGLTGPLILGALWPGVTRAGAVCGFIAGVLLFALFRTDLITAASRILATPDSVSAWLAIQTPNPYSCTALAMIGATLLTIMVSLITRPLPADHLQAVFGRH